MFLEFYVFGERVIRWVRGEEEGGGGGYETFHLLWGGVLNIFWHFWVGAKFYGKILEYPPPSHAVHNNCGTGHKVWVLHILYGRSLMHFFRPNQEQLRKMQL